MQLLLAIYLLGALRLRVVHVQSSRGTTHPQNTGQPVQKYDLNLEMGRKVLNSSAFSLLIILLPYPFGHFVGVCIPVMVVQDEDRRHYRRRHHEHDAIEIGSCKTQIVLIPFLHFLLLLLYPPRSGTASDVAGIVSATIFKNTVNDRRIVTPVKEVQEGN